MDKHAFGGNRARKGTEEVEGSAGIDVATAKRCEPRAFHGINRYGSLSKDQRFSLTIRSTDGCKLLETRVEDRRLDACQPSQRHSPSNSWRSRVSGARSLDCFPCLRPRPRQGSRRDRARWCGHAMRCAILTSVLDNVADSWMLISSPLNGPPICSARTAAAAVRRTETGRRRLTKAGASYCFLSPACPLSWIEVRC